MSHDPNPSHLGRPTDLAGASSVASGDVLEEAVARTPAAHRLLVWEPDDQMHTAIRGALGPHVEHWEVSFVRTPEQLRAAMDHLHFDVVLADVDAAGPMASLLAEVALRAPWALRVVTGRAADEAAMVDAISAAHQFVARPIDMPRLLDDLAALLRRRNVLRDVDALRVALADTALPAAPGLWLALSHALEDQEAGAADMARIIEGDVAVTAKVLSLANSAYFGLPRRVTDIRDAVVLLGGQTVHAIVLAAELAAMIGGTIPAQWMRRFEAHAVAVAAACRVVAPRHLVGDATAAGLLHDIGSLVLARHHPEIVQLGHDLEPELALQLERDLVGATHAEIGGMLLHAWGLPDRLVDAVIDHHAPSVGVQRELTLAGVVHVANAIVTGDGVPGGHDGEQQARAVDYLGELGLAHRLPEWLEKIETAARIEA